MQVGAGSGDEFPRTSATVAFVDLAGFSAIADVHGDESAVAILERFEALVRDALSGYGPPVKWIGDEAMLAFPEPEVAIRVLGPLLQSCRNDPRLPLTRTGVNHGPVVRRSSDIFGSTVNIAARVAALAAPGQLLATQAVADAAAAQGILVKDLGKTALRSVATEMSLFEIEMSPLAEPAWIDPVCKMHAPYAFYRRSLSDGPWFCSLRCEEAYRRSPHTYSLLR